jgi:hypothetical protein
LFLLLGGTVGFWLLVFYPARLLWGDEAVFFSAAAGLLCLVPTAATLVWSHRALHGGSPNQQLAAILGGTGVRMAFVIGLGLILFHGVPELHHPGFLVWVVVFYLWTLALEMSVLLTRLPARGRSPNQEHNL